jgi:hypothetical protein
LHILLHAACLPFYGAQLLCGPQAEASSAELNAGSRRQYAEQRMTYLTDELLYA